MKETQKAVKNFPLSYSKVNMDLIRNIIRIKRAAAIANLKAKKISGVKSKAIVKACKKGIRRSQFPISALQGGAGTSINMNVNEVIAKMAKVDSLDHVNLSQSTNDVCSSALRITSYLYLNNLIESLGILIKEFNLKTKEFKKVKKLSRTHLQDAVPTTLGKEFKSYADILKEHLSNLKRAQSLMLVLNLGGAAIGEGNNTGNVYVNSVYKEIKNITGVKFILAKNLMAKTSSLTDFLIVSQAVVALSVDLSKIANDFRLMSSGPRGGFGEILLPRLQKGSSIMPGKVNPVVSELVNQWHFLVSGNNLMIEKSAEAGQ
ncbi:MAG: lyase family protein, partial [Patescibacteria group bacterium]|nr:lyase family protein [Patescibacteria group bacterium]